MKKFAFILALALSACAARTPLSLRVVESEMARCPKATFIDGLDGRLKWNYTTGLELKAFLDASDAPEVLDYVDEWYDEIIDSTGHIYNYEMSRFSLDHICPGRTLFQLYDLTGKEKYRMAMDTLYLQLLEQPRTPEGGFWHKAVYPEQMWLDGLYMAEPFLAEYTIRYLPDSLRAGNYEDIVHQFLTIYDHTLDAETGLLRHAWDSSREMFWCDPDSGQSAHAWGRAMGWYMMGLVDVIELFPDGEQKDALVEIFKGLASTLPVWADSRTGMWYQVMDRPYGEGNYLEATVNAMLSYAYLKGCRLGILDCREYAVQTYENMVRTFVSEDGGLVSLNDCCEVAGLGGKKMRSGDYDYYIHERVRANDPKGIGPLIWASLEYERL